MQGHALQPVTQPLSRTESLFMILLHHAPSVAGRYGATQAGPPCALQRRAARDARAPLVFHQGKRRCLKLLEPLVMT